MAERFRSAPDLASVQATYQGPLDSPASARLWVAGLLTPEGVDQRSLEDATLVVSELVTNALIHGAGTPGLSVTLTCDAMKLAVTDDADIEVIDEMRAGPGFPSEAGGLGLRIVEQLALAWGVVPLEGGKTVWAVLPR